jgi:hypothetical protein
MGRSAVTPVESCMTRRSLGGRRDIERRMGATRCGSSSKGGGLDGGIAMAWWRSNQREVAPKVP